MIKNHPWENGNKRMGMVSTYTFAGLNHLRWEASEPDIYITVTWVAASEARCYKQAVNYLGCYFEQKLRPEEPA